MGGVAQERTVIVASALREGATGLSEHRAGVFVTDASADINLLQRVDLVMKGGTVYKRDGRPVESAL